MIPGRIELIVQAAEAALGDDAGPSEVRNLAAAAADVWSEDESAPDCVRGVEIHVVPEARVSIRQQDTRQNVWEWTSRAIAAAPRRMPTLLHLHNFGRSCSRLRPMDVVRLAIDLDHLVSHAGLPALRLEWADALDAGPGDQAVLSVLPELLSSVSRLTGHIRVACPAEGRVESRAAENVLAACSSMPRTTRIGSRLGLSCRGAALRRDPGIYVRGIGSYSSTACRTAAEAWSAWVALRGSVRSGFLVLPEASSPAFDVPDVASSDEKPLERLRLLASAGAAGTIWV